MTRFEEQAERAAERLESARFTVTRPLVESYQCGAPVGEHGRHCRHPKNHGGDHEPNRNGTCSHQPDLRYEGLRDAVTEYLAMLGGGVPTYYRERMERFL